MNGTAEIRMNEWTAQVSNVRVSHNSAVSDEDATLDALTRRCRGRGFARAASEHTRSMDAMVDEARATAPAHYRWDELCADGRGAQFRSATYLGRQVMDVDDFAAYFAECRAQRRAQSEVAVAEAPQSRAPARTREESRVARLTGASAPVRYEGKGKRTADRVIAIARDWLCPDDPELRRKGEKKHFPVSVIAVLVVIAVSLMLIVSSSVMVAGARREVSDLGDEVALLEREAKLTQDKLESSVDYLEIYRTATEELGMIPSTYVDLMYVDTANTNSIEVLETEEEEAPGLSTLLAAIGINIGS